MVRSVEHVIMALTAVTIYGIVKSKELSFTGANVAVGKATNQEPGTDYNGDSALAVDGNKDTNYSQGSCSHTSGKHNTKAFWSVNLGGRYILNGIRIYNRATLEYRFENFKIIGRPGNTILYNDETATPQLYLNEVIDIPILSNTSFSNITIEVPPHTGDRDNGVTFLHLCEVEIYSEVECSFKLLLHEGNFYQLDNQLINLVKYNETITATCKDGYEYKSGDRERICLANRTFSGEILVCTVVTCGIESLNTDENFYELNDPVAYPVEYNETILGNCKAGYEHKSGDMERTCLSNKTLSGEELVCSEVECSFKLLLHEGNFYQLDNQLINLVKYNETITATCKDGYEYKSGDRERICLANGTLSGEELVCTVVTCGIESLNTDENFYELNDQVAYPVEYNETILGNCKAGYEHKSGDMERTCLSNKTLSGEELVCSEVECSFELLHEGNFYQLDNQLINLIKYNETITATCKDDHEYKSGDRERICLANGTFSGEELVCTAVTCGIESLNTDENFYELNDPVADSVEYNETILGNCKAGYEYKSGDMERTCLSNKTLSGEELVCSAIPQDGSYGKPSLLPAAVGGSVAGVVVLAAVGIVAVVVLRRSKKRPDAYGPEPSVVYDSIQDTKAGYHNDTYQNCNEARLNEVENEPYYNFTTIDKTSETAIKITDLAALVLFSYSMSDRFTKEFQSFQEGMVMSHKKARENQSKNRYRNLYAYDDTRVVLKIWDEKTETDYINACFIHGFKEPRAYIASQGPVTDNLSDFWRMVWQTHCGKIVMLTNLREEGKMKCNQYWPKDGTKVYGSITVTLEDTETFSNFAIRTLQIKKTEEQQRTVLHFHFTSWPDKDVPFFCSSLVHFRHKVQTASSSCSGPIVVHCSAGIGRTGTFIAIDYLIDESRELGCVDVASCVATLRRQRVNMVQTKKQYEFVHQALVETLVMKTSVVPASEFEESYRDLLSIDPAKRTRKLDGEFEMLWRLSPKADDKKKAETGDDDQLKEKSRYSDNHPAKEHMPSLSQQGLQLFGEFIDASFLPTYKENNALVITQSPLESTKEDFWKMVYYQDVHTIVMMNHVSELEVSEIYWPDEEINIKHGDLIISNEGVEIQGGHTIVTLGLSKSGEGRQIQLIQFGGWKADTLLPKPRDILSALYLVEENQRRSGNHPVVVHCMDGVEKSGLFCVIAALLERTKIEQDVAISQVIEEMRNRRENVIPNVQQFEFLHEVMLAFLQQFETYSNFSL